MSDHANTIAALLRLGPFPDTATNSVRQMIGARRIVIYGAGSGFVTFQVFVLQRHGLEARVVLDRKYAQPTSHMGIPACSPRSYRPTTAEQKSDVVVITVGKEEHHDEIRADLLSMGYDNVLLASQLYEYHLPYPSREVTEKGFAYYQENREEILACLPLFGDDLSREVYARCIETHLRRKPTPIPRRPPEEQYFPADVTLHKGYSRVVNCGAYQGETISRLNSTQGKVDAVVCFEPDPINFSILTRYMCRAREDIARDVVAFPCGVYDDDIQLRFSSGCGSNSTVSDQGTSTIQCVALDHALPAFGPTLITMDIEGVELHALQGAEATIRQHAPDLAVCVYHSPEHLWKVPLYLKRLQPDYRFYLRNYTSFVSETVLYATVPPTLEPTERR